MNEPQMLDLKPGKDYAEDWAKVDSLEKAGLPESSKKLVDAIFAKAQAEGNQPQMMKALIFQSKYSSYLDENSIVITVARLEKVADSADFPLKQMLHSVLGECYSNYYSDNSWQIRNRTQTSGTDAEDLRTWDANRLIETASKHYALSIENADSLRRVDLAYFDPVIIRQANSRDYRPSLFDLLAWRAFDFFRNNENSVAAPANQFQLDNEVVFDSDQTFVDAKFESADSSSKLLAAVKLLQELTKQHLYDKDPSAAVFVTLERFRFAKTSARVENKNQRYLDALLKLHSENKAHKVSAFISARIAEYYVEEADKYDGSVSDDYKEMYSEALKVLNFPIDHFNDADGTRLCKNIYNKIHEKSFQLVIEEVNSVDKPFLGLATYRNVDELWFRVVHFSDSISTLVQHLDEEQKRDFYLQLPIVQAWSQKLPADSDHNSHAAEIMLPPLKSGKYMVLIGGDAKFSFTQSAFSTAIFNISNLGMANKQSQFGEMEFVVFDRNSGEALKGVNVKVKENYYDYDLRRDVKRVVDNLKSNENGFFTIRNTTDRYKYYQLEFEYKGDRLALNENWSLYKSYQESEKFRSQTHFFTDRGIYRPGQTVYFKGICIETNGKTSRILPKTSRTVTFYDANGQKVSSQKLTTNDFGSYSGSFVAPQGQLNGQMRIQDEYGSTYFSVEDYKRPKFEVNFEPIKGSFKLGQKVKVEGKAVAFAGSNIDGAEIKYRVVRNATFPWWGYWCFGRIQPSVPSMEIISGVGATDEFGKFEIEFEAIPDRSLSEELKPQFSYQVYVDVVDITGETHSASTNVNVGYLALNANVLLSSSIEKEGVNKFKINTLNLNGQKESASGEIVIHQLEVPQIVYSERNWNRPDKFILSEADFRKNFPNNLYKDENNPKTWKRKKEVFRGRFDTAENDSLLLSKLADWESGKYFLELTCKDKFGATIKSSNYFNLSGKSDKQIPENLLLWTHQNQAQFEPGDNLVLKIGTAMKSAKVLFEVEENGKIIRREWVSLAAGMKELTIPIEEKHRGNFNYHLLSVQNGRVSKFASTVTVPWTNKILNVEFGTFRDKLQPGSNEEWTVKIKGPDGDKVAAELLTGMYDASLDEFRTVNWDMSLNRYHYSSKAWETYKGFDQIHSNSLYIHWNTPMDYFQQEFDAINFFGFYIGNSGYYRNRRSKGESFFPGNADADSFDGVAKPAPMASSASAAPGSKEKDKLDEADAEGELMMLEAPLEERTETSTLSQEGKNRADLGEVKVRTNLNETAFFFPQLQTDAEGNVVFKFTMPEALTRWRFMTFAHTKDLKVGKKEANVVTQKELMVMPNPPRFFRENDEIVFMAKVSSLSEADLNGQATLELFDALTMQPIDTQLGNKNALQSFSVKKGQSAALTWKLKIPAGIQAVTHRVKAVAGTFSDGEENALPVLTNSMLVTEAMPLPLRPLQSKEFVFKRMKDNKSTTLRNHKLTLEFTSNPAWYAVQALPYLMEYPYECTEQTFSRFYANSLASHIANKYPRIKQVFEQWKTAGKEALLSNLEKNQELKYLLLEETPWVMNAQDESERKKRVGLLFDLNKMADELGRAKTKLVKAQVSNGGFTWFPGMPESRYITQHVVTGFGHLDHLGVTAVRSDSEVWNMLKRAVAYLDMRLKEDYEDLLRHKVDMTKQHVSNLHVQYLYARSYFKDLPINSANQKAFDYYKSQAGEFWLNFNKYNQGMIALGLKRYGEEKVPMGIIRSLKEFAQKSDELGMYWKANGSGLYWYEAPIETQALLIEAFDEVANDQQSVEEMKLWLLKQKQTQDWKTTKATTEACYALLLRGADYLAESKLATITIGGKQLDPANDPNLKVEAGTGYFKTSWMGTEIKPEMANVSVKNNNKVAAWGAVYWQYFEQLDKITFAENKLQIVKQLFLEENTANGPKLNPVKSGQVLKPGDKVKVRILLETDRDMEYVHMKDMRAAGFEPINVLSRYKYQDGLGYYETTRDAATNFFFDWLPKGKYVFEYPLRVTHQGDFSNGITTIQCMYAPEFTSHSEGLRVKVAGN